MKNKATLDSFVSVNSLLISSTSLSKFPPLPLLYCNKHLQPPANVFQETSININKQQKALRQIKPKRRLQQVHFLKGITNSSFSGMTLEHCNLHNQEALCIITLPFFSPAFARGRRCKIRGRRGTKLPSLCPLPVTDIVAGGKAYYCARMMHLECKIYIPTFGKFLEDGYGNSARTVLFYLIFLRITGRIHYTLTFLSLV